MQDKRYIAVCDILGFKELVKNNPLDKVVNKFLNYLMKALYHSIHHKNCPKDTPSLDGLKKNNRVGFAWFSDTMLFYGLRDTKEAHRAVIETLGCLLFETMMYKYTRIRAGIFYGEVYIDEKRDIFVGPAIIEAHQLEKIQEWSGAALSDSAASLINEKENWIVSYDVPIKLPSGQLDSVMTLAVNWTNGIHHQGTLKLNWSGNREHPLLSDFLKKHDVIRKWSNTKRFHESVCKTCKSN